MRLIEVNYRTYPATVVDTSQVDPRSGLPPRKTIIVVVSGYLASNPNIRVMRDRHGNSYTPEVGKAQTLVAAPEYDDEPPQVVELEPQPETPFGLPVQVFVDGQPVRDARLRFVTIEGDVKLWEDQAGKLYSSRPNAPGVIEVPTEGK